MKETGAPNIQSFDEEIKKQINRNTTEINLLHEEPKIIQTKEQNKRPRMMSSEQTRRKEGEAKGSRRTIILGNKDSLLG